MTDGASVGLRDGGSVHGHSLTTTLGGGDQASDHDVSHAGGCHASQAGCSQALSACCCCGCCCGGTALAAFCSLRRALPPSGPDAAGAGGAHHPAPEVCVPDHQPALEVWAVEPDHQSALGVCEPDHHPFWAVEPWAVDPAHHPFLACDCTVLPPHHAPGSCHPPPEGAHHPSEPGRGSELAAEDPSNMLESPSGHGHSPAGRPIPGAGSSYAWTGGSYAWTAAPCAPPLPPLEDDWRGGLRELSASFCVHDTLSAFAFCFLFPLPPFRPPPPWYAFLLDEPRPPLPPFRPALAPFRPVRPGRGPFLATPPAPDCFVFILPAAGPAPPSAGSAAWEEAESARLDPFSATVAEPSPRSTRVSCCPAPPAPSAPLFLLAPGLFPFFLFVFFVPAALVSGALAAPFVAPAFFLLTPGRLPFFLPSLWTSSPVSPASPLSTSFVLLASLAFWLTPRLFPRRASPALASGLSGLRRFSSAPAAAPPSPSLAFWLIPLLLPCLLALPSSSLF
mmetsp:Transcript_33962/g.81301  ORF Transcript_33962/g.81301 Transcript_33962/m.81301 type:complete len:506 (-) Transcript_33962:663-2180(-)